jgi:dTDP-4-amino-4,6-dideoxygalactose transaminase
MFVPRIPSYRVPVLVDALAGVNFPRNVVGIRPGEKLHEMMIPPDEAHNTRIYEDYYVVFPAIAFGHESHDHQSRATEVAEFAARGHEVPPGFSYASDTNTDWMTVAELHAQVRLAHRKFFNEEYPANGFVPHVEGAPIDADQLDRPSASASPAQLQRVVIGAKPVVSETDVDHVAQVLRSGMLTTGPQVEKFEHALCEQTHASSAVAVSNGTAALHVAYFALGAGRKADDGEGATKGFESFEWSAKDAVLVPAITFAATANAVKYCGGVPVFVDVDPATLLIDVDDARKKLAAASAAGLKVRAITTVDMCGQPSPLKELRSLADEHGLALVVDAAHSLGAEYKGASIVSMCDVMTMSFHPVKTITAGEGGAVFSNSSAISARARAFRQHGMSETHQQRESAGRLVSDQSVLGFNYRLSDIHCALGLSQLSRFDQFLSARNRIAGWYASEFAGLAQVCGGKVKIEPLQVAEHTKMHAYHLYVVRLTGVNDAVTGGRNGLFKALKELGVGVNLHYIPVYEHSYYQGHKADDPVHHLGSDACPKADAVSAEMMSLPMWPGVEQEDVHYVVEMLAATMTQLEKR